MRSVFNFGGLLRMGLSEFYLGEFEMKKMWIVVFAVILLRSSYAQTWMPQGSGVSSNLYDVSFVGNRDGWAVGDNGVILHTTNGGETWLSQSSGVNRRLLKVAFTDVDNGLAAGDDGGGWNGIVLHTTNGGAVWTIEVDGGYGIVSALSVVNRNTCWAGDGYCDIFNTMDGGGSWNHYDLCSAASWPGGTWIYGTSFVDANHGWVVGGNYWQQTGSVVRTVDGGGSWSPVATISEGVNFWDVFFVDTMWGWICGSPWPGTDPGKVYRSTDGGGSWTRVTIVPHGVTQIRFCDRLHGIAVGLDGTAIYTATGGTDWQNISIGTTNWIRGVHIEDPEHIWAVGDNGVIYEYSNCDTSALAAPGRLIIMTQSEDAHLSWSPVDSTVDGCPARPNRYLVFFSESYAGPYYFLAYTSGTDTTYVHGGVVTHSPSMYYHVSAWAGDPMLLSRVIPAGSQRVSEFDLLARINERRRGPQR